ncbi:MAG TPA: M56 family metallopeptidase [Gemmatimonadaceae bacterium]|nr:M56 family metallopeptidase [Gemmatimonadaceae bacterium]
MFASGVVLLLKVSVVFAGALILARLLRRSSAVVRHQMWSAVFVALLATPVVALLVPGFTLRVPSVRTPPPPVIDSVSVVPVIPPLPIVDIDTSLLGNSRVLYVQRPVTSEAPVPQTLTARLASSVQDRLTEVSRWSTAEVLSALTRLWLAGAIASLVMLLVSLLRVHLVQRRATPLDDAGWRTTADRIAARFGITTRVRVLASTAIRTPMAGGIVRPVIFVPAHALGWTDDVRDIVITHEMAHIASRDPLRLVVSRIALALYWMHPLAWLAARRATVACEQACDEAVLEAGVRPSNYATVLLDFAEAPAPRLSAALPIVRRSILETRLMAILDKSRRARRGRPILVATGTLLLATTVAAAKPVEVGNERLAAIGAGAKKLAAAAGREIESARERISERASQGVERYAPAMASPSPRFERQARSDERCSIGDGDNFNGSISMSDHGGSTSIHERVGHSGSDYIIEKSFNGMRVCALGRDMDPDGDVVPSAWSRHARVVVLETRTSRDVRHMEIANGRVTYTVNGDSRPVDAAATAWQAALFNVLDESWRLSVLRGRASSLRGEISSIHGMRSSMFGEISSLKGELSSMRGEISSWRGRESSLRGEISSIRGHLSSLHGAISSERGAISSLKASRWDASSEERERIDRRIRRHEERIRDLEREIRGYDADARVRAVEHRIASMDVDGEIARIQERIRDFDLDGRVAEVQQRIADLDVRGLVRDIERQIDALDVSDNTRRMESRIAESLERLRAITR